MKVTIKKLGGLQNFWTAISTVTSLRFAIKYRESLRLLYRTAKDFVEDANLEIKSFKESIGYKDELVSESVDGNGEDTVKKLKDWWEAFIGEEMDFPFDKLSIEVGADRSEEIAEKFVIATEEYLKDFLTLTFSEPSKK